jgi:IS5 family transposase
MRQESLYQYTLIDIGHGMRERKMKRKDFLEEMDKIIPWFELISMVEPYYTTKGKRKYPVRRINMILRMYLLQCWFNLSDEGVKEVIYDSCAMCRFMSLDPKKQIPDAKELFVFRQLLEEHNIYHKFFEYIHKALEKRDLMMRGETIVNATISAHLFEMIVLTTTEWLNWVATGHLRCDNRVYLVIDSEDMDGFTALMASTPEIIHMDDGAFIFAELKPNWNEFQEILALPLSLKQVCLRLEAVQKFFPVSERGTRILQYDAERANVALGEPIFQNLWSAWTKSQTCVRANRRGITLAEALGLNRPSIKNIPNEILPFFLEDRPLPKVDIVDQSRSTCAFGWAGAFSLFGYLVGEEEKRRQTERLHLDGIVKGLRQDYCLDKPVIYGSPYLSVADKLSAVITDKKTLKISIRFLVIVFHYCGILTEGKEINFDSFIKDLAGLIEMADDDLASNAAYLIGRKMEDIPVIMLHYAKSPEMFPSLIPSKKTIPIPNWRDLVDKKPLISMDGHSDCQKSPSQEESEPEIPENSSPMGGSALLT